MCRRDAILACAPAVGHPPPAGGSEQQEGAARPNRLTRHLHASRRATAIFPMPPERLSTVLTSLGEDREESRFVRKGAAAILRGNRASPRGGGVDVVRQRVSALDRHPEPQNVVSRATGPVLHAQSPSDTRHTCRVVQRTAPRAPSGPLSRWL